MSIPLNDNIEVNAPKPTDPRYFASANIPWASVAAVNAGIPSTKRHLGLTVSINNVEYWYKDGIADGNLVLKVSSNLSIVSNAEMEAGTENTKYVTASRIATWFTWIRNQANTWVGSQSFNLPPILTSTLANEFLRTDSAKKIVSVPAVSDAEMQTGTENTKPTTALRIANWFTWRLSQPLTFGSLSGLGNRMLQTDSVGAITATQQISDLFISNPDVINAINGATFNVGNNFTSTIAPSNSAIALQGTWYNLNGFLYFTISDNIVSRLTKG